MLHQIWCKIDVQTTLYKWEFSSIRFKHAHSKLHVQATIEDNIRCSILLIDIRLYKNTRSTAIDWHYVSRSYEQGQQQLIDSYIHGTVTRNHWSACIGSQDHVTVQEECPTTIVVWDASTQNLMSTRGDVMQARQPVITVTHAAFTRFVTQHHVISARSH